MMDFFNRTFFAARGDKSPHSNSSNSKNSREDERAARGGGTVKVLKKGPAMRVIFFYPGEEGTYIDNAEVTLYENGIIQIRSNQEETTTHLQNCEILWRFETDADDRSNKVRLLKPKAQSREGDDSGRNPNTPPDRIPEI